MGEMFVNINNEPRVVSNVYANIGGVWKPTTVFANIDGSFTVADDFCITKENVDGFKIIYASDHNATYEELPHLKYNPKIPASLTLTGVSAGMDLQQKGVFFQYSTDNEPDQINRNEQEGILKFYARIYLLLKSGIVVDITSAKNYNGYDPDTSVEKANFNRLGNASIQVRYNLRFKVNGINTDGWNSVFSTTNHIGNLRPGYEYDHEELNSMTINISPENKRERDYHKIAEIGIARDLHTPDRNMIGSYGNFTHTYESITIDGVRKPFLIEIHE